MGVKQFPVLLLLSLLLALSAGENGHYIEAEPECDASFIVVGTGAAGSVVAAKLAERFPSKKVLIIDGGVQGQRAVGGTDYIAAKIFTNAAGEQELDPIPWTRYDVPALVGSIRLGTSFLNNTWSILINGTLQLQIKAIGGNMVGNGQGWFRPYKYDFDSWGVPGFTSNDLWPLYIQIENVSGTEFANDTVNHSIYGPIKISESHLYPQEASKFYNACLQLYPNGTDLNSGVSQTACFAITFNARDGIRESTSVAYLAPALIRRNLRLVKGCTVTQVLFKSPHDTTARGVECVDYTGNVHKYTASTEVVISAGNFGSPKILFNSGIGPESILRAFGKPLRKISPYVGQKIRNQQGITMQFNDSTLNHVNFGYINPANVQFTQNGTGWYTSSQNINLSLKVNPLHPINDILINQGVGTSSPIDPFIQQFAIGVTMTYNNYANGTLNLTTSDPLGPTIWSSNYFEIEDDINTVTLGIMKTREVMAKWNGHIVEVYPGTQYATYDQIRDFIIANKATLAVQCHYHSSVYVGNHADDPLDNHFRVRGIDRLRVIDASSCPGQVSIGMQATATVMGVKGADVIIADHPLGV